MALNVTGGALSFEAEVSVDKALQNIKLLTDSFNTALQSNSGKVVLDQLNTQLQKLTAQAKIYKDALNSGQVKEPVAVSELNNGLTKTEAQLKVVQALITTLGTGDGLKELPKTIDDTTTRSERLQVRLRALISDLAKMREEGQTATPEFSTKLQEATELEHALKNVRKELELSSSNVAGFEALGQAFRGLIGGAEALAGTFGLVTDDAQQAEQIIKNLVSIQAILNGVQELGAILDKNSALNIYLLALQRKFAAAGAIEQAAATEAVTAVEAEGIAVTEAATVAQEGLNLAMLANPVGIILASVVALYLAYEVLANTVFKTSDAEKQREASLAALKEAEDKAADSIAQEQGNLNILIETAKNKTLSDEQRTNALEELHSKYPEYLSSLNLENVYTKQASESIQRQTELIRARSLERAAEEVYIESIKEQIKKQNELNETTKKSIEFDKEHTLLRARMGGVNPSDENASVKKSMEDLNDATIKVDGAFETFQGSQQALASLMGNTTSAIGKQTTAFGDFGQTVTGAIGSIASFSIQLDKNLQQLHPPDQKQFEKNKQAAADYFKFLVDQTKEGTAANLKTQLDAQKYLLAQEKTSPDVIRAVTNQATLKPGQQVTAEDAAALSRIGDIQKSISDLNDQFVSKALQNAAAAASALVLTLQAAGQKGSEAFFDAQEKALKKSAQQQLFEAKDNAGQRLQIEAQLQDGIASIEQERQKQRLENEKSITQVRLNLAKEGSQDELDQRIKLIDIAAKEELLQAGKNQDKINEINSNAEKQKFELKRKFAIEADETETNIRIAGIQKQLAAVQAGTEVELNLKKGLIDQKARLDIDEKSKQIKNEELLQAEILRINAEAIRDKKKAEDDYITELIRKQFLLFDNLQAQNNIPADFILNNPTSNNTDKAKAEMDKLQNEAVNIQQKINAINNQIAANKGDITQLSEQLDQLHNQKDQNENNKSIQDLKTSLAKLQDISTITTKLSTSFKELSVQAGLFNSKLGEALATMAGMAGAATTVVKGLEAFKTAQKANGGKGDLLGEISAGADIASAVMAGIQIIINGVKQTEEAIRKAKQAVQDFDTQLITGEEAYQALLRERARQQAALNDLTLQGIIDHKKLLDLQKQSAQQESDDLLKQIQALTYVVDVQAKKKPLLKRNLVELFGGADQIKTITASLAGKTFDQLEELFNKGQLQGKAKDLFEQLQKLKQEGLDIDKELQDLQNKANEIFTGTTQQSIADSIRQGLAEGKKSVADFADDFNSLITNAILSAFEAKEIQPAIEEFYKKFAELSSGSGGALSTQQIQELRDLYNNDINQFTSQLQSLQQISGVSFGANSNTNSLVGGIKAMSEQTAEVIGGQLGGMRLVGIDQLSELKNATSFLNNIESNTALTAARLQNVYQILLDVTNNAKQFNIK